MSEMYAFLSHEQTRLVAWSAFFANSPSSLDELAQVVIPSLDETLRWKDCPWQPRFQIVSGVLEVLYPQRGNDCLVIFDDDDKVWVVMYWPF